MKEVKTNLRTGERESHQAGGADKGPKQSAVPSLPGSTEGKCGGAGREGMGEYRGRFRGLGNPAITGYCHLNNRPLACLNCETPQEAFNRQ